jgi:citrate lyase beta subunit
MNAVAAIHPVQLPVISEVLTPSAAQIDWAHRVLAALDKGAGVGVVQGAMVDAPVAARAARILARAAPR